MNSQSPGYTLIEVLMVILIVGLFALILTPNFNRYKKESAANVTKTNLESLRTAIQMYYDDQHSWPPDLLLNDKLVDESTWPYKKYIAAIPRDGYKKSNQIYAANSTDNAGGWVYDPMTGKILPNLIGNDPYGKSFINY